MPNTITPVPIQTREIIREGMNIQYPQIGHISHPHVRRSINEAVFHLVHHVISEQHEKQGADQFAEMIGLFEIKTNERNILSLTISNYSIAPRAANGLTIVRSLTFDVQTGKQYTLPSLFLPQSPYVAILSAIVQEQITARDIPTLNNFTHISPNQDFYIADKTLVLYFQEIEITPHYIGIPMFPISVYEIEDIINPDSALGRMVTG
ncbi:MAG TPA: RsiV family protein [Bacillota bacterium]|nr:RsiV family protein [Bacillota bacterium]